MFSEETVVPTVFGASFIYDRRKNYSIASIVPIEGTHTLLGRRFDPMVEWL